MAITEKSWDRALEKPLYEAWQKSGAYRFKDDKKKGIFAIDTPPPYVNTPVHIGQATTYVLMDFFARFNRMIGKKVLFPLGLDRNGLPIEMAVEQRFNVRLNDVKREEFLKLCEKLLAESSAESIDSFLRLGIGFSSWEESREIGGMYLTDSADYRQLTQETFIDLWNKGLIYKDARINNFCPGCQTTIADAEIEYVEKPTNFNDLAFRVKETGEKIIIGTTRPELVCTCGMVIFNPKDERYRHLNGKTAISPIFEKEIPIRAHPLAEIEKGTGLAMMCSAGDLSDIRFFREMNLQPVIAIERDGTMNENAGFLKGLKVKEARGKMVEELEQRGLLVARKQVTHRTPTCERSKHDIEFIAMEEYYLKQLEFREDMKKIADSTRFFDESSRQILLDWIDSLAIDWPISRRRYYATEVPLWYCKKCNYTVVPPKGKYYRPWKENAPIKKCPKCGNAEFAGEERVFDTWFDSSNSPLYILKYARDENFFRENAPCTLRPQGKEIIRTWLYYTLLKCFLLTGKGIFRDAWINYHIVDEKGHKMSKSKGNVINPKEVLDKFGAEPFRLWASVEGNLTKTDFRCSSERIAGENKTLIKLWNIAKFISQFPKPGGKAELREVDLWILNELNELGDYCRERYENYDFHSASARIKNFLWEIFASQYLEIAKNRAYNDRKQFGASEQNGAIQTLYKCLETILLLWAPVIPFITYKLYMDLYGKDVHFMDFPKAQKEKGKTGINSNELIELNGCVWKAKKDAGMGLRDEIAEIAIPKGLKALELDLKEMHNAKKIGYGNKIEVKLK
ncbi:MAG: valine--tRNA ligase [Candidatus Diapherotrites archaeon]|nr:valine--tRNA ligase [Candidatus Diapherotrites archaeon]